MKNNAKKIFCSIVSTLLLSVGFTHAAETLFSMTDLAGDAEIVNMEASSQQPTRFCGEKDPS